MRQERALDLKVAHSGEYILLRVCTRNATTPKSVFTLQTTHNQTNKTVDGGRTPYTTQQKTPSRFPTKLPR